jgi:excinuclease ABC subunit C
MAGFLKQFYDQASMVPSQILLPHEIEEAQIIKQWLGSRRQGESFEILVPRGGQQQELIQMAAENAAETLAALQARWQSEKHRQTEALAELQSALELAVPPNRIECYDISNTQGTSAVGSMVWKKCSSGVSIVGRLPRKLPINLAKKLTRLSPCYQIYYWWMVEKGSSAGL